MTTPARPPLEPPVSPVPVQGPVAVPSLDEPEPPEPEPERDPEPPELPPAAEAPASAPLVRVLVRLRNGEQHEAAAFADPHEAREHAKALVDQLHRNSAPSVGARERLVAGDVDTIFLLRDA